MIHWNPSPHPISDIRDWSHNNLLELRPSFQRKAVWTNQARIMLIDSILRNIPMPKIYLANTIKENRTHRKVIDGQQRISSILAFLRNEFSLEEPYTGEERGMYYRDLNQETKDRFLRYQIDFSEAFNPTEDQVREVYTRVNKYTVPLNKQELRRADFPGDFLDISEELASLSFFDSIKLFTTASRRRYTDVEYVSEILAAMIAGVQEKKDTLDNFYIKFTKWDEHHKKRIIDQFNKVINEIKQINSKDFPLKSTRFRQKADFYSLFLTIGKYVSEEETILDKELKYLRKDLEVLNILIRPESPIEICSEYAIKCVSQANSMSSRKWRNNFLKTFLSGTYKGHLPDKEGAKIFYKLMGSLDVNLLHNENQDSSLKCVICDKKINNIKKNGLLVWHQKSLVYQISNSKWIHRACRDKSYNWLVLERTKD